MGAPNSASGGGIASSAGVAFRALVDIFSSAGTGSKITITFIEIYNKTARDLLSLTTGVDNGLKVVSDGCAAGR